MPAPLSIAMIGTRGVPAAYGGFETAVEEIGGRLAERGHEVTVYCRGSVHRAQRYHGMRLVHLPALPVKQAETLSHTALSTLHAMAHRPDVAFVFNAANAPFLPLLRVRGVPTALHMDGLEWRRAKWSGRGRDYYRWAEGRGVRTADALIADAPGIADYYRAEFGVPTELLRYGAPILEHDASPSSALRKYDLQPDGFHLVVARFEPENHVREIVDGYRRSAARLPLVVVGSAPYGAAYTAEIQRIADDDSRIRLLGGVYEQSQLDDLYRHAHTYLHGHSVGGTNPSLLRAMGAGTAVIAYDVDFNRETLNETGWFFQDADGVVAALTDVEAHIEAVRAAATSGQRRARTAFRWDEVADGYEALARDLVAGRTIHPLAKLLRRQVVERVDA
ncbi:glycosyltransferase [Microbacterium sp. ZW T5_56]|uniref:glycosyltransferase n=1 Tax=Microbacterium sp. ZW T5_56 TaxID=3378081 RepID=UPI003852524B